MVLSQINSTSTVPRLGLCCQFMEQPIKFRTTTATSLLRLARRDALAKLSQLCLANAQALQASLQFCADNGIGCFRVNSQILPVKTHPEAGYAIDELPDADAIVAAFRQCRELAVERNIRTVFHPDQFVVLNSPRADVVEKSIRELEYQAEVAEWVGADVINIHAGGGYGDKPNALVSLQRTIDQLPDNVRVRLTLENDDTTYTPLDLVALCRSTGIPLVYDVHHHRCLSDQRSVEETTEEAISTWNREPLFHISSPKDGSTGPRPQRPHDYMEPADFPSCWRNRSLTIEVESKAKELAVLQLRAELLK